LAILLAWAQILPAWAVPAQEPLLGRVEPVPPNVMLTLDDSGSMSWNFMPDTSYGGWYIKNHPGEPDVQFGYTYAGAYTTRDTDWVAASQRSSDFNLVYYNPEITYKPWSNPDGTLMPAAVPSAARVYPLQATPTVDLQGAHTISATYCYSLNSNGGSRTCALLNETIAPATYYRMTGTVRTNAASFQRVRIMDSATFAHGVGRTDCTPSGTGTSCTQAQEYQNFANWYQYHRIRNYMAIGALSAALAAQTNAMRLGYGVINRTSSSVIDGVPTETVVRGVRPFEGADRLNVFSWLYGVQPLYGTPLRKALGGVGDYFSRTDNAGPWGRVPGGNDSTAHLACRKSYQIMTTDGLSDTTPPTNAAAQGNVDGTTGPVITGPSGESYQYTPAPPYKDGATGTLADAAMYYWSRDLRPDLPNVVPASAGDPAFWQHMSTYTIGMGIVGTLRYPTDFSALSAGTLNWPSTVNSASLETVDDLWHAAVNGRGQFLSARNSDELVAAFKVILDQISRASNPGMGAATSGRVLDGGNKKFRPSFTSGTWSGELIASRIDASGTSTADLWHASQKIPLAADRHIVVGTGVGTPTATSFTWATLNADQKAALGESATANEALVNYLRGDRTGEGNTYRKRESLLGDIVNSAPAYVKGDVDLRYDQLLPVGAPGRDSYAAFRTSKAARAGVIYVGANDGMLHAFRESDGVEAFAFIPRSVLGQVGALSRTGYQHRYFVDGPLTESDAYLGGAWTNVLVGSTGAGARSIFALDVTRPASLGTGSVMWEFSQANDTQMGNVLAPIEVGRLKNGQWAAVFGNGYQSQGNRPSLFIVNLETGALIKRIDAGSIGGIGAPTNGLGGVRVLRDGQQTIVAAYAGDLQGNLWKFDLSSTSSSDWQTSFGGAPLYQLTRGGGAAQPITAAPTLVGHPRGGYMVLVGSGKLFEEGDQISTALDSVYGIWDRQKLVEQSSGVWRFSNEDSVTSSSQIKASTVGSVGDGMFSITAPTLDWTTDRGWRIDLSQAGGQRLIISPQLVMGLALFETLVPGSTSSQPQCESPTSATGYSLLVDPINGGQSKTPTIDRNRDGIIDNNDSGVGVWQNKQWNGASAVLSDGVRPVCTGPGCAPPPGSGVCPAGTVRSNLQGLAGTGTNVCVAVPQPSRWWWRQVGRPD